MEKFAILSFVSIIGISTLAYSNRNKDSKANCVKRKKLNEVNSEMDSIINARIPNMNNQNSFNMRDNYFKEEFFKN